MESLERKCIFSGLLIEESLKNVSILDELKVIKKEVWGVVSATGEQPSSWTAVFFEVPPEKVDKLAKQMSDALKPRGWYLEISDSATVYVVFPEKIFKYCRGDMAMRSKALEYGKTLGIPENQLDWKE